MKKGYFFFELKQMAFVKNAISAEKVS